MKDGGTRGGMRATSRLVEVLREAIVTGRIARGQRLTEAGVARALGVSRTPVREAFFSLERTGLLINCANGRGFEVRPFTAAEVEQNVFVRKVLEVAAVDILVSRSVIPDLTSLKSYLREEREYLEQKDYQWVKSEGWMFHRHIISLTGNSTLEQCFMSIMDQIRTVINLGPRTFERMLHSHEEHTAIVEAIERRNVDLAVKAVRDHLSAGEAALLSDPSVFRRPQQAVLDSLSELWQEHREFPGRFKPGG